MSAIGYHIRTHLADNRVIASCAEERRLITRILLRRCRHERVAGFDFADTHGHIVALCGEREASGLCRDVESAIRQRLSLPVGFEMYPLKPIADQQHLYNAVRYVLTQDRRHGVWVDPLREASNLPDLLGLRPLGAFTASTLRRWLPRLRREEVLSWLGVSRLESVDEPLEKIPLAVKAAACLSSLAGSSRDVVAARHGLITVVGDRLPAVELARRLGVSPRTVQRLRGLPSPPALTLAIRRQLDLIGKKQPQLRAAEAFHW